jgi:hypothetical protein
MFDEFIGVYTNAFTKDFCDEIIAQFKRCQQFGVNQKIRGSYDTDDTTVKDDTSIDVSDFYLSETHLKAMPRMDKDHFGDGFHKCLTHYYSQYDVLKNCAPLSMYNIKIQETKAGQGYHVWHSERGSHATGERELTFILYLNDIEDGGETEFLYQRRRIKPEQGTLVIFPAGFTHTHRGNPPLKESKYIITGWLEY